MKKYFAPIVVLMTSALLSVSCTDAKQSAPAYQAPKAPATTPPAPTPPPSLPPEPPPVFPPAGPDNGPLPVDCDPAKDFAALEFPENIQTCLKQDKLFNFDLNTCTSMGKALWACDFATFTQNLRDIELATTPLDREKANGGKLIGCGASNDGYRMVAQFFYKNANAPTNDCKFSSQGRVVSVCFQKFVDSAPRPPTTEADKKTYVAQCMQE